MALNKVLLLNDVELLKLIQDNGYEDVANILENRHIDGKQFLELSEFQTFTWKLPPTQLKNLLNFIKSVKEDPYIIIKRGPATNINTNKLKPNLPSTPKPTSFRPKPLFTQTPSQENATIKKISQSNLANQNEFKQKLGTILDGNNSPRITPSPKDTNNKPIFPKPYQTEITKPRQLPPEPDSPDEPKMKPKAFLPEPTKKSNSSTALKNKIQKPKPIINKPRPISPQLTYEDIDSVKINQDEEYLTPKEFDDKHLAGDIIEPENTYEPPPTINKRTAVLQNSRKVLPEILKLHSTDEKNISLIASRGPIPIPTESDHSDDEINNYEPIPEDKLKNLRNNMKTIGGYLNIQIEEMEENIARSIPEAPSQRSKKIVVEDLTNVIIIEREESRRPTNFLEKINSFFTAKSKPTKQNDSSNYENHMLQSELPTLEIPNFKAFQNRPLPEIPINQPTSTTSSLRRHETKLTKIKQPMPSAGSRSPRKRSNVELPVLPEPDKEVTKNANEPVKSRSARDSLESQKGKTKHSDNEIDDLPEYENHQSLKNSTSSSQRNSVSPMPILPDDLALKLSEALKAREKALKQKSANSNKLQENSSSKRYLPPPESDDGADADDQPFYGNVDETASHSSSSLKAEASVDNILDDDFEERDQPIYGNIDDEEEVHEEEAADINNIEEEENVEEELEEYIDSIFNINNEKYYRNTDRKGAKQLLRNLDEGAFLFRPSRRYFLVLTLKTSEKYYNLGIERTSTNKIRLNADSSSVSPEFGTLRAFVDYFKKEALTFRDGDNLVEICLKSVLPADLF